MERMTLRIPAEEFEIDLLRQCRCYYRALRSWSIVPYAYAAGPGDCVVLDFSAQSICGDATLQTASQ